MKEFVEKLIEYFKYEEYCADWIAVSDVKTIIVRLAEEFNQGWIPVAERLPEEETKVIVSTTTGVVRVGVYTKRYGFGMKEGFICDDGFMYMNTALAWQPLPEPYKEEQ